MCWVRVKLTSLQNKGYGIINATGTLWRAQRKAGLKLFSGANLDLMIEEVLPEVYAETTRKQLLQASKDGSVVDLQKLFLDLTTTVVGHMAYDVRISRVKFPRGHPQ